MFSYKIVNHVFDNVLTDENEIFVNVANWFFWIGKWQIFWNLITVLRLSNDESLVFWEPISWSSFWPLIWCKLLKGLELASWVLAQIDYIKRTSVQKSNKNEIFMARIKNSNCLNFCTQVDPSKTRKAVYFFSSNMFLFSRKTNFSLSPSRIDGSGHNRSKIEHFRSLRISKILRLGKSYQRVFFHRLFVFCKM